MDATTYTANGGVQTVNNSDTGSNGFYPDFIWTKPRSITANHQLVDSVRGSQYFLYSNLTNSEGNNNQFVTGFNSNGFGLGTANYGSGTTMVAWQWNAGSGTTSSNTSGSITSTVSVNAAAGFSIATWTGNGSGSPTIGHGLGVTPNMIVIKNRSAFSSWPVYHSSLTNYTYFLRLDATDASGNSGTPFGAAPNSTTFTTNQAVGTNNTNISGNSYVAYCWTPVAGFSQFGSYTGNGSTDGTFVYLGFRPKFVMFKASSTGGTNYDWFMEDSTRSPSNQVGLYLTADLSDAETSNSNFMDFLSNGFKMRSSSAYFNGSGTTYVYAAFAENPTKFANAR
jgi:hypothetical protein